MSTGNAAFDRLLLAGAALLALLLLGPVLAIPLHVPLNYNEGWNAYFDMRAVMPGTGPLYPPAGSFVFNNYPPLSFYVVGAFGRFVVGDMIVAGRVVSLLSLLAAGVLFGVCVRRLGGSPRASMAASVLLLLYACSFYRDDVAMDDPQWLARALMLAGLAALLRSRSAETNGRTLSQLWVHRGFSGPTSRPAPAPRPCGSQSHRFGRYGLMTHGLL